MREHLLIISSVYPAIRLRAIEECDQHNLRVWKNANRRFFFYKEVISETAQQEWFEGYQTREYDYMFIVEAEESTIGCMGIRLLEGMWDIYNVILGDERFSKKGYMSQALRVLCSFAIGISNVRLGAKVLSDNPALMWYCRNGFQVVARHSDHIEIELDKSEFVPCPVTRVG